LADRYNVIAFGVFCNVEDYGKFLNTKIIPLDGVRDVKASVGLSLYQPPPIKPLLVKARCLDNHLEGLEEAKGAIPVLVPTAPSLQANTQAIPVAFRIPFAFRVTL